MSQQTHQVFADNFSALRLQRQAVFLLTLTGVETGQEYFAEQKRVLVRYRGSQGSEMDFSMFFCFFKFS